MYWGDLLLLHAGMWRGCIVDIPNETISILMKSWMRTHQRSVDSIRKKGRVEMDTMRWGARNLDVMVEEDWTVEGWRAQYIHDDKK